MSLRTLFTRTHRRPARRNTRAAVVVILGSRLLLAAQAYDWNSVAINGNGFIDGIVYSKAADNTVFIHTDMGGAYRWDQSLSKWMPMTDWLQIGDSAQYNGAESMAADPTDPSKVYLVAGTYQSTAAILRSTDGGRTWLRTDVSGIQVDGNGWGRGLGERMAIDPNRPNIIYYGAHYFDSTHNGLWKSTDYAATWTKVSGFTNYGDIKDKNGNGNTYESAESVGLPFVIFDKSSGTAGIATPVIYAASDSSSNTATKLYRTSDGGATWSAMPGQPTTTNFPQRATLSADGAIMYVTYGSQAGPLCSSDTGGVVYKITNPKSASPTWTAVTPSGGSGVFTAIAMDPTNNNIVYTSAQNNWPCNIWRSTNGGSTWTALNPDSNRDNSSAPWASQQTVHGLTDLEVSPFNHDVAMFNTGFGIYRTTNLTATTPTWTFFNAGFEQSVPMELDSPNTGSVHLVSAVGDRGGYRHVDFNVAQSGLGQSQGLMVGTDNDIKAAWNDANYVVRVTYTSPYVQYSNDNGVTWTWGPSASLPANANAGYAAISADGLYVVYAGGSNVQPVYATRSGSGSSATWSAWQTPSSNRPAANARVIADLAAAHTFYAISGTTVYRSTDGGATWTTMASNVSALSSINGLRPVPGNSGHMLASTGTWSGQGLLRSTDGGATWSRLSSSAVSVANEVGVGAAAPGQSYPAIYVAGTVNGLNGFFRSDDQGATWVTISDLAHQYGAISVIQGDPRIYGRLYVGAHGRGILYGDIHNAPSLPSGWSTQDIGSPGSAGSAGSASAGSWEVTGGGAGITGTSDQFRFAYTTLTGDGSITARVLSNPSDTPSNHNALAGVMIRSDLTAGSANVLMAMSPGSVNGAVFKYRTTAGGSASTTNAAGVWNPYWVRLTRAGNLFTAYRSTDGVTWTQVGTAQTITMGTSVYIGLAATAADNNQLNISTFDNVSVGSSSVVGIFTSATDIGSPSPAGGSSYNASSDTYTVAGSGADIWDTSDQFEFLSKSFSGDGGE